MFRVSCGFLSVLCHNFGTDLISFEKMGSPEAVDEKSVLKQNRFEKIFRFAFLVFEFLVFC